MTNTKLERKERLASRMFELLKELAETQPYHRLAHEAREIIKQVEQGDTTDDKAV